MQLLVRRSQRQGGMLGGKVIFVLAVRAEYTEQERADINRYNIGGDVIYNSQAALAHLNNMQRHADAGTVGGVLKGLGSLALAKMNLNITIASLKQGHTIECKDLAELVECEDAIVTACKNVKAHLDVAATFDGREIVVDLDDEAVAA